MNWLNDGIVKAVSQSPFVKDARAERVARKDQFTAAWTVAVGATDEEAR